MADGSIPVAQVRAVIEEMRTIARVAGQCSVEGPEDVHALMAAAEAERAARWADELEAALLAGASGAPHGELEGTMAEGQARGMDGRGLDGSAHDAGSVEAADSGSAHEGPQGTYNCPVCGWNVPHSEHAGDTIERLSIERANWFRWWHHVKAQLSAIRSDCSTSTAKRMCDELLAGRGANIIAPWAAAPSSSPVVGPASEFEDWASHIIAEAGTKADSQVEWEIMEALNKAWKLGVEAAGVSSVADGGKDKK